MNKASWFVAGGMALIVALGIHFYTKAPQPAPPPPTVSQFGTTPPQAAALAVCTGITINDGTVSVAYANCLGKIRGFVDSHAITVEMAKALSDENNSLEMWCVPAGTTDKELLNALFTWVSSNQLRFTELTEMYSDANGTAAILITSLHAAYPCKKDPA